MIRRLCPLLAILLLLGTAGAAYDFSSIENRVSEFTLPNGLKFILLHDDSVPVASFVTYVNAGSSDERIGIWGISHILEHLAFKGTSEVGTRDLAAERRLFAQMDELFAAICREELQPEPDQEKIRVKRAELEKLVEQAGELVVSNEFDTILKRHGGVGLNAFTSTDQTVYFFSLPSNKVELWAYLESSRYVDPVFREFYKEKEVIKEERRVRTENTPIGKLIEELQALAFKDHSYGVSVIGPMSNIHHITRSDVQEYFRRNYHAGNMVIGVVGDVSEKQLKALAEKYFSRIPRGVRNPRISTVEPPQLGEKQMTIYENSQPWLVLGYRCPDVRHVDFLKFSVLDNLFTAGRTSSLQKRLVVDEKKALAVGSMAGFPGNKYPGLYLVFALPNSGVGTDELLLAVEEEIAAFRDNPVGEEELESAKKRVKASLMRQMANDQGLLIGLLTAEVIEGSWRKVFSTYQEVDAITAADIQQLVSDYLRPETRTVTRIERKGEGK